MKVYHEQSPYICEEAKMIGKPSSGRIEISSLRANNACERIEKRCQSSVLIVAMMLIEIRPVSVGNAGSR